MNRGFEQDSEYERESVLGYFVPISPNSVHQTGEIAYRIFPILRRRFSLPCSQKKPNG